MKRLALLLLVGLMIAGCAVAGRPGADSPKVQVPTAAPAGNETATAQPTKPVAKGEAPALYPAFTGEKDARKWGYIDRSGKFAIAPVYEEVKDFTADGVAAVKAQGKWGLIDRAGAVLIDLRYEGVIPPGGSHPEWYFTGAGTTLVASPTGEMLLSGKGLTAYLGDGFIGFQQGGRFGYKDLQGNEVIEPRYRRISAFRGGRAVVSLTEGKYAVIDPAGNIVNEVFADSVGDPTEDGMIKFMVGSKFGYLNRDGKGVIPAQFTQGREFVGGGAVVSKDLMGPFGVINQKGEIVIPMKYRAIEGLGAGLFAVTEPAPPPGSPATFPRQAIFNLAGQQLTGFQYNHVGHVEQDLISVSDEHETFFLSLNGARYKGLPAVPGIGTLDPYGELIRADVDGTTQYVDRSGKLVWAASRTLALRQGGRVEAVKFRPHRLTLVWYPQLVGLASTQVQEQINRDLEKWFRNEGGLSGTKGADEQRYDYAAKEMGRVLVINQTGYIYPLGAAHGMPSDNYYHYDLTTGARYSLPDLFKPGSDYTTRLAALVHKEIAKSPSRIQKQKPEVRPDHTFTVEPGALVIYYYPYAIAAYAEGFPRFRIPFDQIQDLINTDGPFWKALS